MPAYSTTVPVNSLTPGDTQTVWNAESPTTGTASQQVSLIPSPTASESTFTAEITFSGAPGAFQVDVQTANTDAAASYVTQGSMTTVNAGQTADFLVYGNWNFARLNMTTQTANSVTVTGKITR